MRKSLAIATALGMVLSAQTPLAQTASPQQAKPSLSQAVRAAEQRSGGRARKVELENEKGVDVYEIQTVSKDKSVSVLVDPASGSVVRVETPGFLSSVADALDREDQQEERADLGRLEASPLTLAGAIDAAEKQTGGRAIKASLKHKYGSAVFEVHVVKDWAKQKVMVDPVTSQVVTVPAREKQSDD